MSGFLYFLRGLPVSKPLPRLSKEYKIQQQQTSSVIYCSMDITEIHCRPNILYAPEFFAHPHRVLSSKYPLQLWQEPCSFQEKSASRFRTLYFSQCWSFLTLYGDLFLITSFFLQENTVTCSFYTATIFGNFRWNERPLRQC